ncbi:hypothetical protein OV450_3398 [Actinobacteria bacterium OV450]|nr:hypothetical protein OV450_3398 [Actinobacteria bacterium OV450]
MTPEQTRQILGEAIKVLERDGWHQGGLVAADGAVCAMGAINRAATGSAHDYTMAGALAVCTLQMSIGQQVPQWNDDPSRTKEDVILAMKKAAHHDA